MTAISVTSGMADDDTMVLDTIKAITVGCLGDRTGTVAGIALVTTGTLIMDTLGRDSVLSWASVKKNTRRNDNGSY